MRVVPEGEAAKVVATPADYTFEFDYECPNAIVIYLDRKGEATDEVYFSFFFFFFFFY